MPGVHVAAADGTAGDFHQRFARSGCWNGEFFEAKWISVSCKYCCEGLLHVEFPGFHVIFPDMDLRRKGTHGNENVSERKINFPDCGCALGSMWSGRCVDCDENVSFELFQRS